MVVVVLGVRGIQVTQGDILPGCRFHRQISVSSD